MDPNLPADQQNIDDIPLEEEDLDDEDWSVAELERLRGRRATDTS